MSRPWIPPTRGAGPEPQPLVPDWAAGLAFGYAAISPTPYGPAIWLVVLGVFVLSIRYSRWSHTRIATPTALVLLLCWILISPVWSIRLFTSLYEALSFAALTVIGLLIAAGRSWQALLRPFAVSAVVVLSLNILVAALLGGDDPSNERGSAINGIFPDKNTMAFFAVLALLSALHWSRTHGRLKSLILLTLALATLLFSNSATAAVMALIGSVIMGFLALFYGKRVGQRPFALFVALVVVAGCWIAIAQPETIVSLLGRDTTLTGRTSIWGAALWAASQRPVLGYGWRALWSPDSPETLEIWALNYGVPFYHAHNGYLELVLNVGVLGLVLFLLVILLTLVHALRGASRHQRGALWPAATLLTLLLYNTTEVMGFDGAGWLLLVAFAAAGASSHQGERSGPDIKPQPPLRVGASSTLPRTS